MKIVFFGKTTTRYYHQVAIMLHENFAKYLQVFQKKDTKKNHDNMMAGLNLLNPLLGEFKEMFHQVKIIEKTHMHSVFYSVA